MKVVNLKQAILQAWKERWSDYQWAINMKRFFPRGATWDILNLAEALLEQAMIGPSPNPLILSYLKYAISSQMVSYSTVLMAISKFDDFSRDLCVQSLLEIMDMFCDRLSCHGKAEECIGLCRALMSALNWLLRCAAFYAEKVKEALEQAAAESQLKMCLERLGKMLSSTKNRALIHIAKLEETSSWSAVEQSLLKLGENVNSLGNSTLRSRADDCISLIKSIPTMLSVHSEQLNKTGFPTVHAVVLLEGTMNLTGETQPLVEQLMMVKRMQRIPSPLFVLEIWKACFVGLIESPEGTEELKWTAFTFLKIPQVLVKLKKYPQGEKDFTEDVNCAFEFLLKLTPLLDKVDQRCNCDCMDLLLQECSKQGLLSEANMDNLIDKRAADREHAPHLKSAENANIQPNPGLILRAEPTVTNILKTMDADHSKSPEGLLGVLGHMLSGKSLDLLLAAAAATGKLKSFARKFIKLNEFTKQINGEGPKGAPVRALLFDISFLMLCHVAQTYGSEVILSESSPAGEVPFFETWMLTCMPEEGKILNPDHPCFRPDSTKVESLVALLNNSSEMKLVQMKWHEACLSISAAILEILNAWENGVLTFESIQKITDNIKGKVCSMAVCAVAWLVAHVRMLGLDEREKSLQMIRQLAAPLYGENTLQFYNERTGAQSPCLDMPQLTLTLLGHILPNLLTDSSKWHTLMDPPGKALAKLAVWCALSSYSSHNKGQASTRQKKRHREDIEDYISLFPLDDTQPSKLMRLLSSNEEDSNILSSPNRSMSSSLSASQLHTVSMRDPLNRVLANLFLLISSILGAKTAGTHTQFVQWFMEECVDCLEQGSRGSILQFMPFTMVSELVKVSTMSSPKIVLAITDLSLPLGRRVAAKAIAAL
ncbi:PREDICTED: mediator of RNA polymerase II transcription subunit 24 [Calidris pugnax]|uniref:mediator of RNA polymerase II transcription subunit 24 n=1 Tax=Calidris pugnax TaxID=198806 RepID=UPI00071DD3A7|nr:PREDICTED: mediator of RNA polymerase II transcription subunit 24 [Calidris pugnax]